MLLAFLVHWLLSPFQKKDHFSGMMLMFFFLVRHLKASQRKSYSKIIVIVFGKLLMFRPAIVSPIQLHPPMYTSCLKNRQHMDAASIVFYSNY